MLGNLSSVDVTGKRHKPRHTNWLDKASSGYYHAGMVLAGEGAKRQMLYCVKCQNGLPDGTIFCDYCGNEIADGSSVTTAATLPDLRQRGHSGRANDTMRRTSVNAAAAALPDAPHAIDSSVAGIPERLTSPAPSPSLPPAQAPRPLSVSGNSVAPPE